MLFAPLIIDGKVVGLLGQANKPGGFDENDARLATSFAELAAVALKNSRTLELLENSERSFRSLVESTSDWIWAVDANGVYTYASPKVRDILGYEPQEIIGKTLFDLMPPDEAKRVKAEFETLAKAGKPFFGLESVNLHKDGRAVVLDTSGVPILEADGGVLGYRGIDRDITDRKRAEEDLARVDRHFHMIMKSSFDGINICEVDPKTGQRRTIICNDRTVEMSGRSREELMAAADLDDFTEVLQEPADVLDRLASGDSCRGTASWIRPDGKQNCFEWSATGIKAGDKLYIVGIDRDITDRKHAEEALRESEAKYRALVEHMPAVTYVASLDEASTTLYIAPQVKDYLGFSPAEWQANSDIWRQQLHPDDRERVMAEVAKSHAAGKNFTSEYRMVARDGSVVWFRDEASVVRDSQGKPLFLHGVMFDITDRKRAEEALRRSEEENRAILENVGIGVAVTRRDMRVLSLNRQMRKWFPEIDPDQKPLCYASYNDPPRTEPCSYCPVVHTFKDGQVHEAVSETPSGDEIRNYRIVSSPIRDSTGKVVAAVEMVDDITDRKRAEEALRHANERLANIIEFLPDATFVIDRDKKVIAWNRASEESTGVK